jgi:hypothetical protein
MQVELFRDLGDIGIVELSENTAGAVIFEGNNAFLGALTQEHADRRVERRRKLMLRHPRRCQRIANIVLDRLLLQSMDFEQGTMIPETEDGKSRCLFQLPAGALCFTVAKQHENAVVDPWNKPFQRGLHALKRLLRGNCDVLDRDGGGVYVEAVIVLSFCVFGFDCAAALLGYPTPRTTAAAVAFNNSRLRIAEDLALILA